MHKATVPKAVAATATRRNQLRAAQMNMILSIREARIPMDNVLYVYAIPIVILPAVAAVRKLLDVTGCHIASRGCDGAAGGNLPYGAARARHRDAGRREPERRHLWRMAARPDGSRRGQPRDAARAGAVCHGGRRRHGVSRASLRRGRGKLLWRTRPNRAYLDDGSHRGLAAAPAFRRSAQGY